MRCLPEFETEAIANRLCAQGDSNLSELTSLKVAQKLFPRVKDENFHTLQPGRYCAARILKFHHSPG
jgi:hypothetical protein